MNDLTIIILNYNTKNLLRRCLTSILPQKWKYGVDVCVVDNASNDGSVEMVKKEFPTIRIIMSEKNKGFAGGNNLALQKIESDYYLLLNSDTEVGKGSLDTLLEVMKNKGFDIASCKLVNPDGSIQPNAGDLPFGMALFNWLFGLDDLPFIKNYLSSFHQTKQSYYNGERKVGWVSGSAIAFRKEVLTSIGLWDERIFMYCEDVDYCIRAKKAGFTVGWTDKASIMHIGGASSENPKLRQWLGEFKGLLYLYKKHVGVLSSILLRFMIYCSILLRIVGFLILRKNKYARTYIKVLKDI